MSFSRRSPYLWTWAGHFMSLKEYELFGSLASAQSWQIKWWFSLQRYQRGFSAFKRLLQIVHNSWLKMWLKSCLGLLAWDAIPRLQLNFAQNWETVKNYGKRNISKLHHATFIKFKFRNDNVLSVLSSFADWVCPNDCYAYSNTYITKKFEKKSLIF